MKLGSEVWKDSFRWCAKLHIQALCPEPMKAFGWPWENAWNFRVGRWGGPIRLPDSFWCYLIQLPILQLSVYLHVCSPVLFPVEPHTLVICALGFCKAWFCSSAMNWHCARHHSKQCSHTLSLQCYLHMKRASAHRLEGSHGILKQFF